MIAQMNNLCCLRLSSILCLLLIILASTGCSLDRFRIRQSQIFEADVSKEQLVQHVNRNIVGTDSSPGVSAWRSSDAKIQVTGIPFPLPASMAVEAPRNMRIIVTHPISGNQEVDLGSNQDGFWVWTKEQTEMITCSHEDTSLALQQFEMPIQIQPEWLMEVFGVVPINGDDFTLQRPSNDEPVIDLVALSTNPSGRQVERVIRINTYSGNVDEHLLRTRDGEVIATAKLDKYSEMPNGTVLPTFVKISWPAAKTEMKISLGHPEVNPPSFAVAQTIWNRPEIPGSKVVDIGMLSRRAAGIHGSTRQVAQESVQESRVHQLRHSQASPFPKTTPKESPGQVALAPTQRLQAPHPAGAAPPISPSTQPVKLNEPQAVEAGLPEWAREHTAQKLFMNSTEANETPTVPVTWQPSEYSPTTWRSSSVPRHPAPE